MSGPRMAPLLEVQELLDWTPGSRPDDAACRASVPLAAVRSRPVAACTPAVLLS